jgi:CheY-like chemotaxis protein
MDARIKVLVVDDNVDAADLLAEYLRFFGVDVVVAHGGIEGLTLARALLPTLIFLDIGMPEFDGYQVAMSLRSDTSFASVKIVALTAWGDISSREKSKTAGFDLHITKPANLDALLALAT